MNLIGSLRNILRPDPIDRALRTADIGITELDQPDADCFFNHRNVSHIVVDLHDFDLWGDAETVCGAVAAHGDPYATFEVCAECASGWAA